LSAVGSGRLDAERLFVRTIAVPDTGDVLAGLPRPDVVSWVRRGAGLAGWGEAARVTLPAGEDRFTAGQKWLRQMFEAADTDDRVGAFGTGLLAFGTFTFDPSSEGSVLVIPRAIRGRDGRGRAWLTTIGGPDNAGAVPVPERPPSGVRWHDGALSAPDFELAVARAVAAIKAGALKKVVLARDQFATAAGDIDARVLLRRLADRYPDCYTFACDGMIGATPELYIRREGRQVSSLVLAGTLPRGATAAEDDAIGAALLADAKNVEEHAYAAASLRETLGPLCEQLDMPAEPELIKLPNLQHLGTHVRGTLRPDLEPGTETALGLTAAVHPTAAVCGTPTDTAAELIRELEHMDRERYAGPVGWVDADGNGEWGIALRCAQLTGRTARLFAGGGIMGGSDPAAELAEAQIKFRPLRNALEG
jgi:menaquinone-specific isochorismate synthase